jgi:hypothetical protein
MAEFDAHLKQSVIALLVGKSERPAFINKRFLKAYGEVTVGMNTVGLLIRWIKGPIHSKLNCAV